MQLTNVLRDVGEDIERDRVYLPLDELEKNGIQEAELDGKVVLNKTWSLIVIIMQEEQEPTLKRQDNCCHYYLAELDTLLLQ